jgi:hypothetical protein
MLAVRVDDSGGFVVYTSAMIGDENDSFARGVQGICAMVLLPLGLLVEYYSWTHPWSSSYRFGASTGGFGILYVGYRCARYALTGQGNINRDDF